MAEVHPVAHHPPGHPVDDHHRAVGLHVVHQAHVGQPVVDVAVAVAVVGLAEEDQVPGQGPPCLVESAVAAGVAVDGGHPAVPGQAPANINGNGSNVTRARVGLMENNMTAVIPIISRSVAKSSACRDRKTQILSDSDPILAIRSPVRFALK